MKIPWLHVSLVAVVLTAIAYVSLYFRMAGVAAELKATYSGDPQPSVQHVGYTMIKNSSVFHSSKNEEKMIYRLFRPMHEIDRRWLRPEKWAPKKIDFSNNMSVGEGIRF